MDDSEYVKQRLDDQISWYDKKSIVAQRNYKRLQIGVIVASSLIPFLTGFLDEMGIYGKIVVGGLGFAIASASGALGLFRWQENWLEYRTTCESLRHEKYLFLTKADPYDQDDAFSLLVSRAEGLISKQNSDWSSRMKSAPVKKKAPTSAA